MMASSNDPKFLTQFTTLRALLDVAPVPETDRHLWPLSLSEAINTRAEYLKEIKGLDEDRAFETALQYAVCGVDEHGDWIEDGE